MNDIQEKIEDAIPTEKPVEVQPHPWVPMLGVFFRQLGLVGGSTVTLFQMVGTRDLRGLFDYIRGEEFLSFVLVIVGIACLLWGHFRELRIWKRLSTLANRLPDSVAIVLDRTKFW